VGWCLDCGHAGFLGQGKTSGFSKRGFRLTSSTQVREVVRGASKENAEYLGVVERASFLVCLDDASPARPAERAYHCHFGDGSNRWWDKGMQFAVCSNGISGQLVEHAMIDASTVYPLNVFLSK
jgi:carnitine O-acetyltransferase